MFGGDLTIIEFVMVDGNEQLIMNEVIIRVGL